MNLRAHAAVIVSLAALPTAGAQEASSGALETVTVTGTRLADMPPRSISSTVIGAATIESHNKQTVPALLAEVAGIHTSLPGGRGSVGEVVLRGGEPNFTAVLIDGIQLNDPTNTRGGSFDFSTLAVEEIETIEILRGPMSPIYGSDALSGVINIVTHRPREQPSGEAALTAGGEDLASATARFGGPIADNHRLALNAGIVRDGRSDAASGYRNENLSGTLELFADGVAPLVVRARHSATELHAFPESSGGPRLAVLNDQDRRQTTDDSLGLSWRRTVSPRSALSVRAAVFAHGEDTMSPGVARGIGGSIPANRSQAEFARRAMTVYLSSALTGRLDTALGIDYERQRGESEGSVTVAPGLDAPTGYDLRRDNLAVFAEAAYSLTQALEISAALRHDDNDSAPGETTGRLGLSYTLPGEDMRFRLAWSRGYKLPSLFSLGDALVGNPALESETVTSWEAGADIGVRGGPLSLRVTAFSQRFENLIDFDFEQFMSVNRDRVQSDGLEIGVRYRVGEHISLLGHGTWVDLDVVGSERGLRQRPARHGGIGVEWSPAPSIRAYAGWRYVGARLDASIPTGEITLPSYARLDASVDLQLARSASLQIAVDNLTDRRYEDAVGFPSLGARVRLTLRAALTGDR